MDESDDEIYITQNSLISTEIGESDVISGDDVDMEEIFDRLLDDVEIKERVRQSVALATRYKDEWAVRALNITINLIFTCHDKLDFYFVRRIVVCI